MLDRKVNNDYTASLKNFLGFANEEIQKVAKEQGVSVLIAGGAVRDAFFGTPVRDVDVFVDFSTIPEDAREDFMASFSAAAIKAIAGEELIAESAEYNSAGINRFEGHPDFKGGEGLTHTYELAWKDNFIIYDSLYIELTPMEDPDALLTDSLFNLQFIGRDKPDVRDPNEFIEDFDYPLVKCYVHPETGDLHYSSEFMECPSQIMAKDDRTLRRVQRYLERDSSPAFTVVKQRIQLDIALGAERLAKQKLAIDKAALQSLTTKAWSPEYFTNATSNTNWYATR